MKTYFASASDTALVDIVGPDPANPLLLDYWVLSDLHLGHERLEVGGPLNGTRPPNCTELLCRRWAETVGAEDNVLVLGDVLVGWPLENYGAVLRQLGGHIVVIAGNHESRSKISLLKDHGWRFVPPLEIVYRGWLVRFTHEPLPDDELPANSISVHGHIHHRPERTIRHINTSAEALDYRPQRIRELLDRRIEMLGSPET